MQFYLRTCADVDLESEVIGHPSTTEGKLFSNDGYTIEPPHISHLFPTARKFCPGNK